MVHPSPGPPPLRKSQNGAAVAVMILNTYIIAATKAGSPEVGVVIPTASPASLGVQRPLRTGRLTRVPPCSTCDTCWS